MQQQTPPETFDLAGMVADLNSLLRLKTTVIGIKMFARVEEMNVPGAISIRCLPTLGEREIPVLFHDELPPQRNHEEHAQPTPQ